MLMSIYFMSDLLMQNCNHSTRKTYIKGNDFESILGYILWHCLYNKLYKQLINCEIKLLVASVTVAIQYL